MHQLTNARRAILGAAATCATALCVACASVPRATPAPAASNRIEVDVRTSTDSVARFAFVRATFDGTPTTLTLTRQSTGRFTAMIPDGARRVTLRVSVPEHGVFETLATLPAERPAVFRVRPRPLIPSDSMPHPRVVGDFNGFTARPSDHMVRGADGRLRVAVPFKGDSARFLIEGVGGPSAGAWMRSSTYAIVSETASEVSFAGVLRPVRDTLFFELDTAQLHYDPTPPALVTMTADSALNVANALALERHDAFLHSGVLRFYRPLRPDSTMERAVARARAIVAAQHDSRVRTQALLTVIAAWRKGPKPVDESRALLAENGPGSSIAREESGLNAISQAFFFSDQPDGSTAADSARWQERIAARATQYMLPTARDAHVEADTRRSAYMMLAYQLAGTKSRTGIDALIAEAVAAFPTDQYILTLPSALGSQRILREGVPFPEFALKPLGLASAGVSNVTLRGKLTLIDFWATWCAPCVEEMPVLHRAYERFKDRGFTILSVSADESVDDVARIRRDKWPMPWLHAWSGGGPDSPALKALGVIGFPTAVLIDSAGRIIAVNDGLRGEALERTLAGLLPK